MSFLKLRYVSWEDILLKSALITALLSFFPQHGQTVVIPFLFEIWQMLLLIGSYAFVLSASLLLALIILKFSKERLQLWQVLLPSIIAIAFVLPWALGTHAKATIETLEQRQTLPQTKIETETLILEGSGTDGRGTYLCITYCKAVLKNGFAEAVFIPDRPGSNSGKTYAIGIRDECEPNRKLVIDERDVCIDAVESERPDGAAVLEVDFYSRSRGWHCEPLQPVYYSHNLNLYAVDGDKGPIGMISYTERVFPLWPLRFKTKPLRESRVPFPHGVSLVCDTVKFGRNPSVLDLPSLFGRTEP